MHIDLKNTSAILLIAFAVACVSAWLTINGMISLYQEVMTTIIVTMVVLEVSKITIAGWLIIGRRTYLKYPLITIMLALMVLSLWGHYGYFTDAYAQRSVGQATAEHRSSSIAQQIRRYEQELNQLQTMLDNMPDNYVTKREQLYNSTVPRRQKLNTLLDSLYNRQSESVETTLEREIDIGPFRHLAAILGLQQEAMARLISIWLAAIIDPLAILLIMAGVRKQKPYRPLVTLTDNDDDNDPDTHTDIFPFSDDYSQTTVAEIDPPEEELPPPEIGPPEPKENTTKSMKKIISSTTTRPLTETNTLVIAGNPLDGVHKLAPALKMDAVKIYLSPSNYYLEELCRLLPSVKDVVCVDDVAGLSSGTFLTSRPSLHSKLWAPNQYTKQARVDKITPDEWMGALKSQISGLGSVSSPIKGTYINLGDRAAEQSVRKDLSLSSDPRSNGSLLFHHLDTNIAERAYRPDFHLLESVSVGMAYTKRLISLGPLSGAFELFGLDYRPCQGRLSDKITFMYLAAPKKVIGREDILQFV